MTNSTDVARRTTLQARLVVATHTVRSLIFQIKDIENNAQASDNEKLSQIKKIREEIAKVGTEIDSIKKEFIILNSYSLN
jgi:hypothetical protein